MNYKEAKSILRDKYKKGLINQKQYFNLVSKARAKYLSPVKEKPVKKTVKKAPPDLDNPDGLLELFDGKPF